MKISKTEVEIRGQYACPCCGVTALRVSVPAVIMLKDDGTTFEPIEFSKLDIDACSVTCIGCNFTSLGAFFNKVPKTKQEVVDLIARHLTSDPSVTSLSAYLKDAFGLILDSEGEKYVLKKAPA